jgi:hypothetical protein
MILPCPVLFTRGPLGDHEKFNISLFSFIHTCVAWATIPGIPPLNAPALAAFKPWLNAPPVSFSSESSFERMALVGEDTSGHYFYLHDVGQLQWAVHHGRSPFA